MARQREVVYADMLGKMELLEGYGGDKQIYLQHLDNGMVQVIDKQTLREVVVFMADEWKMLLEATGVDKNQHSAGSNPPGLNAEDQGTGQEDPGGELRYHQRIALDPSANG